MGHARNIADGQDDRGAPRGAQRLIAAVELAMAETSRSVKALADLLRQPGAPLPACGSAIGEAAEGGWISAIEFALLVGIGETSASAAMAQCARGRPWHGVLLEVRSAPRRGRNRWEVRRSSIPEALLALAKPANAGIADWIGCEEFGRLFGLYRRRALRVCQDATRQIMWRGVQLNVRRVPASKRGFRYEIETRTLPPRGSASSAPEISSQTGPVS